MRTLSQALVPEQANVMRGREGDTDHGYFTKQPNPAESRRRLFLAAAPDPGNRFFFYICQGILNQQVQNARICIEVRSGSVHFLCFFTSWIRIRICPCGTGSRRHFLCGSPSGSKTLINCNHFPVICVPYLKFCSGKLSL